MLYEGEYQTARPAIFVVERRFCFSRHTGVGTAGDAVLWWRPNSRLGVTGSDENRNYVRHTHSLESLSSLSVVVARTAACGCAGFLFRIDNRG